MSTTWDPQQYAKFSDHRSRPFGDLMARVGATAPRLVVDLGCGNGPLTLSLAERWPDARVVGVDHSPQMLDAARSLDADGRVEWVESDVAQWDPATLGGAARRHRDQRDPAVGARPPRPPDAVGGRPGAGRMARDAGAGQPRRPLPRPDACGGERPPATPDLLASRARPPAGRAAGGLRRAARECRPRRSTAGRRPTSTSSIPRRGRRTRCSSGSAGTGLRPVLDALTDETRRDAFLADYDAGCARHTRGRRSA